MLNCLVVVLHGCSWSYSAQPTFWVIQQPDEADGEHDPGRFYLQRLWNKPGEVVVTLNFTDELHKNKRTHELSRWMSAARQRAPDSVLSLFRLLVIHFCMLQLARFSLGRRLLRRTWRSEAFCSLWLGLTLPKPRSAFHKDVLFPGMLIPFFLSCSLTVVTCSSYHRRSIRDHWPVTLWN